MRVVRLVKLSSKLEKKFYLDREEYYGWLLFIDKVFSLYFFYFVDGIFVKVVQLQEYKMYKYIGNVALIGSFATGLMLLIAMPEILQRGYIHVKITAVVIMAAYHFSLGHFMKTLKNGTCRRSGMFFRAYNEVPTVILIIIIAMMMWKPF